MFVGYKDILALFEKLNAFHFCLETSIASNDNDFLCKFTGSLDPPVDNMIEIGTYNGISTLAFASMVNVVHTFDVAYRNNEYMWSFFPELRKKISCCIGLQEVIDDTISRILAGNTKYFNLNFAFIDGSHHIEKVMHDFKLVRFCKRVLFHDADMPWIATFVKQIGGKVFEGTKFAYWKEQ